MKSGENQTMMADLAGLRPRGSVKVTIFSLLAVGWLAGCATRDLSYSPSRPDGRANMRNAANIGVAKEADGSLSLLYRQPDGLTRRTTLPRHIVSAEVIDSRERRSRAEYAAVLRVGLRPGHPSECPSGVLVERLFLSEPRNARLIDAPTCGEVFQLGMSDAGDFIGVLLPEGRWLRVDGTQLLNTGTQPTRSAAPNAGQFWGSQGGQSPRPPAAPPATRSQPPATVTPAPVVERPAPPPVERAAPRTIDPASLPSGPTRQGSAPSQPPAARPVFGF